MKDILLTILIYAGIVALILAPFILIDMGVNQLTYGDWTCAFKKCVTIKDK